MGCESISGSLRGAATGYTKDAQNSCLDRQQVCYRNRCTRCRELLPGILLALLARLRALEHPVKEVRQQGSQHLAGLSVVDRGVVWYSYRLALCPAQLEEFEEWQKAFEECQPNRVWLIVPAILREEPDTADNASS